MGSLMPLLAMGLGLFNAMNGQNEDQGDDWADNGDSTDDSSSNDNGYDDSGSQKKSCNKRSRAASSDTVTGSGSSDTEASAFTDTAAPTCRDCGRGVRRSTTARVRIPTANRVRIPQRSDSVDVAAGLQPASVGAPRVATGNHDDLVAASEDVPVTDPAPTGIVRHPAPKMRQQVRAGVSVPRREAIPTTRVVVTVHNNDERRAQSAPIWAPFTAALGRCAPGCVPVQYSAFGQRPHPTCHTQGRAIDVFGFNCGGHVYMAIDRGRYESIVQCMKTKMKVLYRNHPEQDVTSGHRDHGHFSMGCYVNGGHKFW